MARADDKIHGFKKPKAIKLKATEAQPRRDQGFVERPSLGCLSLATGSYASNIQRAQIRSFRVVGCGPEICYTTGVSETVDYNNMWEEIVQSKKRVYDVRELRKQLFGNHKGGYVVRDPHVATVLKLAKKGMSKQPQELLEVLKKRDILDDFRSWGQWFFSTYEQEVDSMVEFVSYSGGTSYGTNLMYRAEMAKRLVDIKRAMRITYLEPVKSTDYASNNQKLFLTLDLLTDLSSVTALIISEDTFVHTDFMTNPKDVNPAKLSREEIDKLVTKVSNALLASRNLNPNVEEEFSDTLANIARNSRTKCLGLCGGRWNIPMLERGKIYRIGKRLSLCEDKHVDRLEMFKLLCRIFQELYENPWKYAITSMDIETERKYYTSCPDHVVIAGGGLHASDTDLVLDAWKTTGMREMTQWTPICMLYSNADYLWVCYVHQIQGRVLAIERIFEVSTPSRVVKSFQSLVPPKIYMPYKKDAIEFAETIAKKRDLHWTQLFSLVRPNETLTEVLDRERRQQTIAPVVDIPTSFQSVEDYWSDV